MTETPIDSLGSYTDSMKKTLLDKCFFIDKVDADAVVDFGCADGELLLFLETLFPEKAYLGYDRSKEMIELAQKRSGSVIFIDSWREAAGWAEEVMVSEPVALSLSSTIHEVYTYSTPEQIRQFWRRVFETGFDFIAVRDMVPGASIDRPADINDVVRIMQRGDLNQVRRFESIWGSLEQQKNLLHFLLKYRYRDNWEREVEENYIPVNRETLLTHVPDTYEIIFEEHFTLPFLRWRVREDFGVEVKDNTHLKLILQKRR